MADNLKMAQVRSRDIWLIKGHYNSVGNGLKMIKNIGYFI